MYIYIMYIPIINTNMYTFYIRFLSYQVWIIVEHIRFTAALGCFRHITVVF